jgi:hypothetical protein
MKQKLFTVLSLLVFSATMFSQQPHGHPAGRLLFPPLQAHHVEPRMGASKLNGEDRLRLDIGNAVDLWNFADDQSGSLFAVGADFFTWTSLRQDKDFHFPVDAVDYLFGVNASWRMPLNDQLTAGARFRLSHISAHLVDGSYDKSTSSWREGREPLVYSREFFDLIASLDVGDNLRVYAGGQYVYHIDPADLGKLGVQAGVEASSVNVLAQGVHLYAAYDFRTIDIHAVTGAHAIQAGVKFGTWRGTGLNVFLTFYRGKSQHGEYHDLTWSYWGPGFTVDF